MFIFTFVACVLDVVFNKSIAKSSLMKLFNHVFSSKSFIVRSVIHFELNSVYSIR